MLGNFVIGALAGRAPRGAWLGAAALLAVAVALLPTLGRHPAGAIALLMVWGFAYGGIPVCSGTWFAPATPDQPEAATVVFTASFQATISIGVLAGGLVVDLASLSTLMVAGARPWPTARRRRPRPRSRPPTS